MVRSGHAALAAEEASAEVVVAASVAVGIAGEVVGSRVEDFTHLPPRVHRYRADLRSPRVGAGISHAPVEISGVEILAV